MSVDRGNGIDLGMRQNLQEISMSDSSTLETFNLPSLHHVKTLKNLPKQPKEFKLIQRFDYT